MIYVNILIIVQQFFILATKMPLEQGREK